MGAEVSAEAALSEETEAASGETSETVDVEDAAADTEVDMEKWLKEADQGDSEQIYEDALKELGSLDRP
jgi:hypothetical protein